MLVLMLAFERFTLVLGLAFMHAITFLPAFWVMSRGKSDNNQNNLITPQCTSWFLIFECEIMLYALCQNLLCSSGSGSFFDSLS